MAVTQGKVNIFGTSGAAGAPPTFILTQADGSTITGYVSPIITGFNPSHQGSLDTTMDESGDIVSATTFGEYLEATFDLTPSGSTLANARISATLPQLNSIVTISGLDIIAVGSFTDALNVTTGTPGGNKWLYHGGGSITFRSDGKATMTLPLRRYLKIAGGVGVVS